MQENNNKSRRVGLLLLPITRYCFYNNRSAGLSLTHFSTCPHAFGQFADETVHPLNGFVGGIGMFYAVN